MCFAKIVSESCQYGRIYLKSILDPLLSTFLCTDAEEINLVLYDPPQKAFNLFTDFVETLSASVMVYVIEFAFRVKHTTVLSEHYKNTIYGLVLLLSSGGFY
jgi:hypothetical protein